MNATLHRAAVIAVSLLTVLGAWLAANGDLLGLNAQTVATAGALINLLVTVLRVVSDGGVAG